MTTPTKSGSVYLIGAGPGDPGLITVRGARLLELADVVVYDYLSNPRLLSYCPLAEAIYVGKKAASHSLSQARINQLLIDQARLGKRVARLKGGDPFVFGRGGEECEALAAAGIAFEVVPGITAAIAVPAYAGIPVTHRDLNSSFTFITGHEKEEEYKDPEAKQRGAGKGASDLDWGAIAKLPCLAFYMGTKSLPRICRSLVENGMDPQMPGAVIQWGTTPRQKTVVGTIADLAEKVKAAGLGPPAMIIIGKVVSLRPTVDWFERRPLFGQTIVVTRTRQQVSDLSQKLEDLGANVIEAPTIELGEAEDLAAVDAAIARAGEYDWIVFTSANGVEATKKRLIALGKDARVFGTAKVAAIGSATAKAIERELCLKVDLCPERFVAEALADAFEKAGEIRGKRFLLLRADIARPVLREKLQAGGAKGVDDVAIYQTRAATSLPTGLMEALQAVQVHWITFTSSSTAANFVALLGDQYRTLLDRVKIASIGPITTKTIEALELKATVQADVSHIEGLVDAICNQSRKPSA